MGNWVLCLSPYLMERMEYRGREAEAIACQTSWVVCLPMASMKHEGLVTLFRNRPALAAELLQGPLGLTLPAWAEARLAPADFPQVVNSEHRADQVVLLLQGASLSMANVLEVQLAPDSDKHKSWPLYLVSLRARLDCPVVLLVVAPDAAVARWCARPIALGHPRFELHPLVLGPDNTPVLLGPQEAGENPELAVLSAVMHGRDDKRAPALFEAVLTSVRGLDKGRVTFYVDLALSAFGPEVRSALEATMRYGTYEYQTEFVRKFVAQGLEQGRQEGRQEGRLEGRQEGRLEGRQEGKLEGRQEGKLEGRQEGKLEGRQEGRLEGERQALLKVLEARGLKVGGLARRRLLACTELAQLERWLGLAVKVQSIQELFENEPLPPPRARPVGPHLKARKPRTRR